MNRTMTRRRMLHRTLAGATCGLAAPLVVPAAALGLDGSIAPSEHVRLAFIGLGNQGLANLSNPFQESYNLKGGIIAMPGVRVAAVCDVDAERRRRGQRIVHEAYGAGGCAGYNDFRDVLARDDIDAVVISTPDHWHAAIGIAAARAGKDVYSEKPLAHNLAEGRAICDAARRYGTVWQTGSQQRSWATFASEPQRCASVPKRRSQAELPGLHPLAQADGRSPRDRPPFDRRRLPRHHRNATRPPPTLGRPPRAIPRRRRSHPHALPPHARAFGGCEAR